VNSDLSATQVVARFDILYTQFLSPEGVAAGNLPAFAQDRAELLAMYRRMVTTRAFDKKAVALQRTGLLGPGRQ